jgi:hypothetical protein
MGLEAVSGMKEQQIDQTAGPAPQQDYGRERFQRLQK